MVKTPNLMAIRQKLPHGSIKEIAERTGLPAMTISNFFNKGWYPEHTQTILNEAVGIIKGSVPDEDLVEDIDELGLTGGSIFYKAKQRKPKRQENDYTVIILGGLLVLIFLLFKDKLLPWISGLFSKNKAI